MGRSDPPVEVILLMDVANTSLQGGRQARIQVENFLRQNGGRLAQPTSLMIFDDRGVKTCHSRRRMGIGWPTN